MVGRGTAFCRLLGVDRRKARLQEKQLCFLASREREEEVGAWASRPKILPDRSPNQWQSCITWFVWGSQLEIFVGICNVGRSWEFCCESPCFEWESSCLSLRCALESFYLLKASSGWSYFSLLSCLGSYCS